MLEGIIVVSFLVMMLMLLVGMAGLYRSKLQVMQEARYRNALNAVNSCRVSGPSTDSLPMEPIGADLPDDPLPFLKDLQMLGTPFGVAGTSRATVRGSFAFMGKPTPSKPGEQPARQLGISGAVSHTSVTACNPYAVSLEPWELLKQMGLQDEVRAVFQGALLGFSAAY